MKVIGLRRRIANLWKLSGAHHQKNDGVLVTLPLAEYNILDCSNEGVVTFFGFIDLSGLRAGDVVEITLKMIVATEQINKKITVNGPVPEPIIDFPKKEGINPTVMIKQTAGVKRTIFFAWRWIKL